MRAALPIALLTLAFAGCDSDSSSSENNITPDASAGGSGGAVGGGGGNGGEAGGGGVVGGAGGAGGVTGEPVGGMVGGAGGMTGAGGAITEENVTRIISFLADDELDGRGEGTPGGEAARAFVIEELTECGVEPFGDDPQGDTPFYQNIAGSPGVNIIGRIPGSDPAQAERAIIVSAHYDHIQCAGVCNGADDNAAGVAVMIAAACELAKNPPARSIIIAAWDAEEPPTFLAPEMGSRYYAEHPLHPLEQTDVMLALDLVGGDLWPAFPFHVVLGVETSPQVADAVDATPIPEGMPVLTGGLHLVEETPLGHQPWSDYDAFRNEGLPVLFFSNGQTKHYHQPTDELATLNFPKIVKEAVFLRGVLTNLGNADRDPNPTVINGPDYPRDAVTMKALLEAALAEGGLIDHLSLSERSRGSLQGDLDAVNRLVESGGEPDAAGVQALRAGAQRIMCLAGPLYPESTCNLF